LLIESLPDLQQTCGLLRAWHLAHTARLAWHTPLLAAAAYDELSLEHRLAMLSALCHLALDTPSIKEVLEQRLEEQGRIKKQAWEEARVRVWLRFLEMWSKLWIFVGWLGRGLSGAWQARLRLVLGLRVLRV
jgi:hypothetical protein